MAILPKQTGATVLNSPEYFKLPYNEMYTALKSKQDLINVSDTLYETGVGELNAIKAAAPPEARDLIQKEIDSFIETDKIQREKFKGDISNPQYRRNLSQRISTEAGKSLYADSLYTAEQDRLYQAALIAHTEKYGSPEAWQSPYAAARETWDPSTGPVKKFTGIEQQFDFTQTLIDKVKELVVDADGNIRYDAELSSAALEPIFISESGQTLTRDDIKEYLKGLDLVNTTKEGSQFARRTKYSNKELDVELDNLINTVANGLDVDSQTKSLAFKGNTPNVNNTTATNPYKTQTTTTSTDDEGTKVIAGTVLTTMPITETNKGFMALGPEAAISKAEENAELRVKDAKNYLSTVENDLKNIDPLVYNGLDFQPVWNSETDELELNVTRTDGSGNKIKLDWKSDPNFGRYMTNLYEAERMIEQDYMSLEYAKETRDLAYQAGKEADPTFDPEFAERNRSKRLYGAQSTLTSSKENIAKSYRGGDMEQDVLKAYNSLEADVDFLAQAMKIVDNSGSTRGNKYAGVRELVVNKLKKSGFSEKQIHDFSYSGGSGGDKSLVEMITTNIIDSDSKYTPSKGEVAYNNFISNLDQTEDGEQASRLVTGYSFIGGDSSKKLLASTFQNFVQARISFTIPGDDTSGVLGVINPSTGEPIDAELLNDLKYAFTKISASGDETAKANEILLEYFYTPDGFSIFAQFDGNSVVIQPSLAAGMMDAYFASIGGNTDAVYNLAKDYMSSMKNPNSPTDIYQENDPTKEMKGERTPFGYIGHGTNRTLVKTAQSTYDDPTLGRVEKNSLIYKNPRTGAQTVFTNEWEMAAYHQQKSAELEVQEYTKKQTQWSGFKEMLDPKLVETLPVERIADLSQSLQKTFTKSSQGYYTTSLDLKRNRDNPRNSNAQIMEELFTFTYPAEILNATGISPDRALISLRYILDGEPNWANIMTNVVRSSNPAAAILQVTNPDTLVNLLKLYGVEKPESLTQQEQVAQFNTIFSYTR